MRILVKHQTPVEGITLPINYHHILQSIIYAHMKESEYDRLHDQAYMFNKRSYRMFTFSEIYGKYKISDKKITFLGIMSYFISSPEERLIDEFQQSIEQNGVLYGNYIAEQVEVKRIENKIEESQLHIKMLSPICVYSSERNTGKTKFFEPGTKEFEKSLQDNFTRKYEAYYGKTPKSSILIKPKCVLPKHKKVTNYKGFIVSGWMGEYILEGEPEMLQFLYEAGLGSKNAEGFGMFEIVKG